MKPGNHIGSQPRVNVKITGSETCQAPSLWFRHSSGGNVAVKCLCIKARGLNADESVYARGDHWAKIVEQRAIKNRVQYIHCR